MELDDVQGLVRFGYKHLTEACFLLLRVKDAAAARDWLAQAPVTSAVSADPLPQTALHVAFTSQGLRALGSRRRPVRRVLGGIRRRHGERRARARRLGDVGANDPAAGAGAPARGRRTSPCSCMPPPGGSRHGSSRSKRNARPASSASSACRRPRPRLAEPFGFADGISQPKVDWERERPVGDHDRLDYDNLVCLGEFLLGYPNEYGLYTPRPLLAPQRDPGRLLPRAEDAPEQADVGRNGCYLVLRQLKQDVAVILARARPAGRRRCRTCASGWPRPWWAGRRTVSRLQRQATR